MLRNTLKHKLSERFNNWPIVLQNREVTKVSENRAERQQEESPFCSAPVFDWYLISMNTKEKETRETAKGVFFPSQLLRLESISKAVERNVKIHIDI